MEASYNLPLDVLRLLFEFSASTSLESAKALSLTSKEVQLWTDPCIFETVYSFDNSSGTSWRSPLEQLCMSNASPRIVRARNYVRAVAWEDFVPQVSSVEKALEYFPNLIQICLWDNLFPFRTQNESPHSHQFEITQMYPPLRRVTTCLDYRSNVPQNAFGSPFWMTITHLQVNYYGTVSSDDSPFQQPLFATMSSLTHLALSAMNQHSEPNADLALSLVKESFPPSLRVCLLALGAPSGVDHSYWLAEMVRASQKIDERLIMWSFVEEDSLDEIVVTSGIPTFEAWGQVLNKGQTYWEAGEMVLKRRQERIHAV
ncbi:hypothetical protein DL96DRAFT_1708131 [Flagelloscypha sp. PMI_526]|nr:hypothetical protein DL96DRAFT_1708131 [Flagelloscypha sp. PMI_526]